MTIDRSNIIISEIAKCQPAHYSGNNVNAVYLSSESIGIIICQSLAMKLELTKAMSEIDRLNRISENE